MKLIYLFLIFPKCLVILLSETELWEVIQLIRYSTLGIQNYIIIILTIPLDIYVYKITYFLFEVHVSDGYFPVHYITLLPHQASMTAGHRPPSQSMYARPLLHKRPLSYGV